MQRDIPTLKGMKQVYENYTYEDQRVWKILFDRQIVNMPKAATQEFLKGIERIGFNGSEIPNYDQTNTVLKSLTGWQVVAVKGLIDDKLFFELMSNRRFPATTWFRTLEELDYLEEPDMFHDVFGHIPLLTNQHFVNFLEELSIIGLEHMDDPVAIDLLSRIYWFTVEFGLIKEQGDLRIYGAGILSSAEETKYSLSDKPGHFEYNVEQILNTPYRKDVFQERYFIIDSYQQLFDSTDEIRIKLKEKRAKV